MPISRYRFHEIPTKAHKVEIERQYRIAADFFGENEQERKKLLETLIKATVYVDEPLMEINKGRVIAGALCGGGVALAAEKAVDKKVSRRTFLRQVGAGLAGVMLGGTIGAAARTTIEKPTTPKYILKDASTPLRKVLILTKQVMDGKERYNPIHEAVHLLEDEKKLLPEDGILWFLAREHLSSGVETLLALQEGNIHALSRFKEPGRSLQKESYMEGHEIGKEAYNFGKNTGNSSAAWEYLRIFSMLRKRKYERLIDEGISTPEAIEIIKKETKKTLESATKESR